MNPITAAPSTAAVLASPAGYLFPGTTIHLTAQEMALYTSRKAREAADEAAVLMAKPDATKTEVIPALDLVVALYEQSIAWDKAAEEASRLEAAVRTAPAAVAA